MKKGINYLLVNSTFLIFIIYLLFKLNILKNIIDLVILVTLSLILSYIIYPLCKKLNKYINYNLSILITYIFLTILLILFTYLLIPKFNFINNIIDLFSNLLKFENILNDKYNLNINLDIYIDNIINYMINNSVFLIKNILNYLIKLLFILILSICILLNIKYIKIFIDNLKYKELIYRINNKLKLYLITNIKIIIIQFIEYTLLFLIIGHPNYLLLGILNSLNTFIPFIGSFITNIIAIITSSVISKKLLLLTSLISIIMPLIDAYIITPKIYKEDTKISQTLYLIMLIICATLFKVYGIVLALPLLIIIIEILKYKNIVKQL